MRSADRPDGRPPARAARGRRRPGDRPGQALRRRGQVVRRGRQPRAGDARRDPPSSTRVPRVRRGRGRTTRARAPELPASRAARAGSGGPRPWRLGGPARGRAVDRGPRAAGPPTPRSSSSSPNASPPLRGARSSAAPSRRTSPRPSRGWRPRAAGRCSPSRPRGYVAASTTARTSSPTTTCCCAPSRSRPRTRRSSSSASATRRPRSRCATGSRPQDRCDRPRRRLARPDAAAAGWPRTRRPRGRARRRARDAPARARTRSGSRGGMRPTRSSRPASARRRPVRAEAGAALAEGLPGRPRLGQLLDAYPRRRGLLPALEKPLRFLANRGANGIDGVVSSAAGAALATGRRPTPDRGARASARHRRPAGRAPRRCRADVVCVNNGGGGIFDFLPVAAAATRRSTRITSPRPMASTLPLPRRSAASSTAWSKMRTSSRRPWTRPGLVEVRTSRATGVEEHAAFVDRLTAALR